MEDEKNELALRKEKELLQHDPEKLKKQQQLRDETAAR